MMDAPPPEDYDPYRGEMIALSGSSNKDTPKFFMQLLQGLTLAGILGLIGVTWNLTGIVTELRITVSEWRKQNDRDIARLESADARHDSADARHDTELRGLDNRLTTLERAERANQSHTDDRQKRR